MIGFGHQTGARARRTRLASSHAVDPAQEQAMNHDPRRVAGLAGLAVAPTYFFFVVLVTALEWDYLHDLGWSVTGEYDLPYPSVLARGDFGVLMMLNFLVVGILIATFARGFRREFRHRISGWVTTVALVLCALAALLDIAPTGLEDEAASWHDTMHAIGFLLIVVASMVAMVSSSLALRGNDDWRGWRWLGWLPAALVVVAFASAAIPGELGLLLFLVLMLGWFSLMGAHLAALARAPRVASPALPDAAAPGLL
jgi:hypothetical protein